MRTYFNIMVYMIKIMVNIDKKYLGTFLSKNENKKGIYIIEIFFEITLLPIRSVLDKSILCYYECH